MKENRSHEKLVGKTANLIIFIGILYTFLSILSLVVCSFFAERGYGITSLIIGLFIISLGYGIRYGYLPSLYTAATLFSAAALYFIYLILAKQNYITIIRLTLSLWVVSLVARSIPAMLKLKAEGLSPDRNSKYKDFFLRRNRNKEM